MVNSHSAQSKTLALLPKFTGFFSVVGSTYIFQDVVFHKNPIHRVYHRLVLGLSCADMVASIAIILSTWPIPETHHVYLASGTTQTCTAQGFFNELGNMATPLYNASLCAYYVLVIRNAWVEDSIRTKAEPWMHAIPIVISSTISILGLPFDLYNNSGWLCWIAAFPQGCQADGTCTRGAHADIFRWLHYAIIWSAIMLITLGMYSIYVKVKEQERIDSRGRPDAEVVGRGRKSRLVAIQALLFVGALYLTWIFTTINRVYNIVTGKSSFVLQVLMATFFPLQGFFNCLIYLRPRYLRSRSRNPDAPGRRIIYLALHHESHPIHGLQNANVGAVPGETEEDRIRHRYIRSSTASYYSVGNSKLRQSSAGEYDNDDASYSINTVNAIASVSEYDRGHAEIAPDAKDDEGESSTDINDDGEALDSVVEESLPTK